MNDWACSQFIDLPPTGAATSDVKDPNFSECNQVTQGFVECHKCLSCEVEVAAFDSCGFMTSRKCTKVQYDEAKVTENCKVSYKKLYVNE